MPCLKYVPTGEYVHPLNKMQNKASMRNIAKWSNEKSSATRRLRILGLDRDVIAGFAGAVRRHSHTDSMMASILASGRPDAFLSQLPKSCPWGRTSPEAPRDFSNFTKGRCPLWAARDSA